MNDKVIVISGGTKGVGRTIADECAHRGAKVITGGRDGEAAVKALHEIVPKFVDPEEYNEKALEMSAH